MLRYRKEHVDDQNGHHDQQGHGQKIDVVCGFGIAPKHDDGWGHSPNQRPRNRKGFFPAHDQGAFVVALGQLRAPSRIGHIFDGGAYIHNHQNPQQVGVAGIEGHA